jgi:hypothetical protein
MLSTKFIVIVLVAIVVVFGLGMFPAFNTMFRQASTAGLSTEMQGVQRIFPYFLFFVIFYAGYIVFRRGK